MKTFLDKENGLTPKQTLIGLGVIVVLSFVAYIWVSQPDAKASTTTLQQSVEMAQADYNLSQAQTKAAFIQYCENWKELALAKAELADAVDLTHNFNKDAIKAISCADRADLSVPSSF